MLACEEAIPALASKRDAINAPAADNIRAALGPRTLRSIKP
jgi:hypothetical protein